MFVCVVCVCVCHDRTEMTPENPLWVGAWWIGFLAGGAAALIIAIPILGYPRQLPGTAPVHCARTKTLILSQEVKKQKSIYISTFISNRNIKLQWNNDHP